ncbi:hypothetical protein HYH03_008415 [Edaphochlamys debaryana]|uniref:Gamma-secretase subunit PEN-2 n=1 Tax=Edaphochlamys debaryana TaxID=47281 RepID=A0A835XZS3_9CHLO|nr:hypothetical protein HYH03_008415 [Edaphochlamys debaryana]|eukprot:KAG2493278.1 hypothetical protein HYH03_008415 [Edaphochlamys debaryana]
MTRDRGDAEGLEQDAVVESIDYEVIPLPKARMIAKRMFFAGCFFLPLLWASNIWLFWPDFRSPRGDPVIKKYTKWSTIGFVIVTVIFLPWLILYAAAGQEILSANVYNALDAASLDLSQYGLGIIDPNN